MQRMGVQCGPPACIMPPAATFLNYVCTIKIKQGFTRLGIPLIICPREPREPALNYRCHKKVGDLWCSPKQTPDFSYNLRIAAKRGEQLALLFRIFGSNLGREASCQIFRGFTRLFQANATRFIKYSPQTWQTTFRDAVCFVPHLFLCLKPFQTTRRLHLSDYSWPWTVIIAFMCLSLNWHWSVYRLLSVNGTACAKTCN
jgi:hypothetical protein